MEHYQDFISDSSVWLSSTPTAASAAFPFYSTEAGHFFTRNGYSISRKSHDSFLLLYTVSGRGTAKTMGETLSLLPGQALLIDCHIPHHYCSASPSWEFLWVHIQGSGTAPLFPLLYPLGVHAVSIHETDAFCQALFHLLAQIQKNDIQSAADVSLTIHTLYSLLISASLKEDGFHRRQTHMLEITKAVQLIQNRYCDPITVDDMIADIPISKYHFIRMFRRVMGITPYQYLMNYRINQSKHRLRLSDASIAAIALSCGFSDPSNFISQFKKHVGQTPSQYQRDFRYLTSRPSN